MNKLETWLSNQRRNTTSRPLPLAHVTSWSNFVKIVHAGSLIPQRCPVFKEELLYLSYGAVAYRPSRKPYSWSDDEPVLLVFPPSIAHRVARFFPFDTGAIAAGRFNDRYLTTRSDFRTSCGIRLTARSAPWHWIGAAFGDNTRYLAREETLPMSSTEDLLTVLAQMQRHFKSDERTDHRLVAVECHVMGTIPLNQAIWLGVPAAKQEEVVSLFRRAGNRLPDVLGYHHQPAAGALPVDLRRAAEEFIYSAAQTNVSAGYSTKPMATTSPTQINGYLFSAKQ